MLSQPYFLKHYLQTVSLQFKSSDAYWELPGECQIVTEPGISGSILLKHPHPLICLAMLLECPLFTFFSLHQHICILKLSTSPLSRPLANVPYVTYVTVDNLDIWTELTLRCAYFFRKILTPLHQPLLLKMWGSRQSRTCVLLLSPLFMNWIMLGKPSLLPPFR